MIRACFAIHLVLFTLCFAYAQNDGRLDVKPAPGDPTRFVCDIGFATFTTPKSWNPNRSGKQTYAILTPADESYPKISKMISIDAGKSVEPTAKAFAEGFAKKSKGKVLEKSIDIDGETAYRVQCPPNPNKVQPIDCIAVIKDGRGVLLIAGAKKTGETDDAMNELVKTWKWKNTTK
jgi:hypothetical protein